MKISIYLLLVLFSLYGCDKGVSYCEQPHDLNGLFVESTYGNQTDSILVSLDYQISYEDSQGKTLFSFSTPPSIFNPTGNRPTDVVSEPYYFYKLKDTLNNPDSIYIEAYAFNDCGQSEIRGTWIKFNP